MVLAQHYLKHGNLFIKFSTKSVIFLYLKIKGFGSLRFNYFYYNPRKLNLYQNFKHGATVTKLLFHFSLDAYIHFC